MNRCPGCGAMLDPGAKFCAMCGRLVTAAPAAPPPPPNPVMHAAHGMGAPPPPVMPGGGMGASAVQAPMGFPAPPAAAAARTVAPHLKPTGRRAASQQTVFEVYEFEMWRLARIVVENTSVVLEAGQLHYWLGQFQMQASMPSVGGIARSFLTKEKAVRPVYTGRGEIWLEPTFGEIEILELNGSDSWILDKGSYLASDATVQLGMYTNPLFSSLFGGEGMFQTQVSGVGKVFYWAPGPVQAIALQGETLTVDGSFAVARSASLDYRVEKSSRGLFGSLISGEGLVNVFRGYGTVILAPVPNRYLTLQREFWSLHAAIRAISRK